MTRVTKHYTLDEQKQIVNMRHNGFTFSQIAQILNRTSTAINRKYHEIENNNFQYSAYTGDYKYSLTPKENTIMALMCKGLDDNEIAEDMQVALCTIKTHTHKIYQKYQVSGSVARVKCVLKHLGYEVAE